MLALVDTNSNLTVWDLTLKKQMFSEMNVDSVAFNLDFEHLLCYSG
jgi:intraflagellar transport protein 122